MKILLFLAVVTLGKASEILTSTSEKYTEVKLLNKSPHWKHSNEHESPPSHKTENANSQYTSTETFDEHPTSFTPQGTSFKKNSSHGLTSTESSVTGTEYSPVVEIRSSSSPPVKDNLFYNSNFATTDSSSDISLTDSDAVPTNRYLTYTDPASAYSLHSGTVNSKSVTKHDSLLPFGPKNVQVVSVDNKASSIKDRNVIGYSPTVSTQSSFFNVPPRVQNYNVDNYPKLTYTREPFPSVGSIETTTKVPFKYSFQSTLSDLSSKKYSTPSTYNAFSISTTTPKTHVVPYNKPLITNIPAVYPSTAPVHSLPFVIKSNPVDTKYVPHVFSKPYSTAATSSLYTKVFSPNTVNTTPSSRFPIFTSSTPTASPTPYSVTVTTPVSTNAFSSENYKPTTHFSYTSVTPKPYSTPVSLTPNKLPSFSKVFSTPISEVTNLPPTFKFYNPTHELKTVTHVASEKSSTVNPYRSFNLLSNPIYSPLSYTSVSTIPASLGISSTTYPNSNTIYHPSPSIHSQQVSDQSSLPFEYPVLVPFRDVNYGQHNLRLTGQQSHYSGNFPQGIGVTEKTVYSTPLPTYSTFTSSTPKPELISVSAPLFAQGYSANLDDIKSSHGFNAHPAFAYTVQSVPLSKEYHTVESPFVRSYGPAGSWKVIPGQYFGKHF